MGYIFNSVMRDYDRNRRKTLKAREDQRAEKAAAVTLRRLIGGARCPRCGQEAYAAKVVPVVPANAGVRLRPMPPTGPLAINCTCPQGHQYQVRERAATARAAGTQGEMKAHAQVYEEGRQS